MGDKPVAHEPSELYNLEIDSSEKFNIVSDHPDVLKEIMNLVGEHEWELVCGEDQLAPVRQDAPVPWQE